MGKIAACLRGFEYKRKARLRLPYALQIQQSFASDLTRVGVPVCATHLPAHKASGLRGGRQRRLLSSPRP